MQETSSGVGVSAADREFLQRLRRELNRQIASYVYEIPEDSVGSPLPAETISNYVDSMRDCLVEPHWEEANICTAEGSRTGTGLKRMCVTMAEDGGYVLLFDPVAEGCHLAWRSAYGLGTWGISGAAVDCFIAR